MESTKRCLVVVVDDEKEIDEYIQTLLRRRKFENVSFADPHEALEFLRAHAESVNIVISDIRMPGIDGVELAKRALEIDNHISVILITGYSDKVAEGASILPNVTSVLDKPVRKSELLDAVEKAVATCRRRAGA